MHETKRRTFSFNPTLVRLRLSHQRRGLTAFERGFNPTLVRLRQPSDGMHTR